MSPRGLAALLVITAPAIAAGAAQGPGKTAPAGKPRAATVAEVLDGRVAPGTPVRVRGRCLGYGRRAAEGPPPRTRSDWLLGAGGRAVYVVGAFPPACEPMAGGPAVTVQARVAVDTLAGLGGPGAPRRYLVAAGRG